jgi:hypothetical protein
MPAQITASTNRTWAASQMWPSGQGPALTSADFTQIAKTDPFYESSYGPNFVGYAPPLPSTADYRFTGSTCINNNVGYPTFNYLQGNPSIDPNVFTCALSYANLSTQAQEISNTFSQTFSVDTSFSGSSFLSGLSRSLTSANTLTWTTVANDSISSSTVSTASFSVQGPPCGNTPPSLTCVPEYDAAGDQPTQFYVYQDNMYGTFMFAPAHYYF